MHSTRTTPSRRITLQFGHIFLTDGRTFISFCIPSCEGPQPDPLQSLPNPPPGPIPLSQLHLDLVTRDEPHVVHCEPVRHMRQDPAAVLDLDPEHTFGQRFDNPATRDLTVRGHERRLYRNAREL